MARIKLVMTGFKDLLEEIQKAEGDVNSAVRDCLQQSAEIVETELKEQMNKAGVDSDLINAMDATEFEENHDRFSAKVGYKLGTYKPDNLSNGYKVLFLNYGTPMTRRTKEGENRGKLETLGFISRAKRLSAKKVNKVQQETLNKIIEGLKK